MNLIERLRKYLEESREEILKVTWPTREDTTRYTTVVIAVSLGVAAFLGALDFVFTSIVKQLV